MPAWSEYKEIAKSRGALALELYAVESRPCKTPDHLAKVLPSHLAYQKKMEAAGKLVLAGPLSDDTGDQMLGSGLIIYRAANIEEARVIAQNDPMHEEGVREFSLRKWLVNEGSLSFKVSLSDQHFDFG